MASIQRVKGRWFGLWKDPSTGKRTSVPLGDSEEAAKAWKRAATHLEREVRRTRKKDAEEAREEARRKGEPSLRDALRGFVAFLEPRVRARTLHNYRDHQRCLERLLPVSRPISGIRPADVDRFVQARLGEAVDPRTIAKEQAFLRRFVRFLHERWPQAVPKDWSGASALKPLPDHAGGPENRKRRAQRPVLTAKQLRKLLGLLQPESRLGARVRFLLFCPVRPVEMLRLRVRDVDLEAGVLAIHIRKNGRAGGERIEPYPIVPPLLPVLRDAVRGKHPEAVVFPSPSGNREQDTAGLCQEWRRWRKNHKAFAKVQLYALRRTVGTAADRTAKNAIVAMGVLNHRTWDAHKRYSDLGLDDSREALTGALKDLGLG